MQEAQEMWKLQEMQTKQNKTAPQVTEVSPCSDYRSFALILNPELSGQLQFDPSHIRRARELTNTDVRVAQIFHALAVVMFVPAVAVDPVFTHLAFSAVFALFVFASMCGSLCCTC
jgi:hypothetical protein